MEKDKDEKVELIVLDEKEDNLVMGTCWNMNT